MERVVDDARKALAEGREPPIPIDIITKFGTDAAIEHQFGVTPARASALPEHLRTSSVQVEPATPPKWMTYAEAEAKVKEANEWAKEGQVVKVKKERASGKLGSFHSM